jgi:L-threonylcarbamoyladenylate synthase
VGNGRILAAGGAKDRETALEAARQVLHSGGMVSFPTESFYGLAVDIQNERAIQRLFEVKRRETDRPVLLLIESIESIEQWAARVSEKALPLMEQYWPGGLTLVLEASPRLSPLLTANTGKIGLRLSSHPLARALASRAGGAVTGTSANRSGQPACRTAQEVLAVLGSEVTLVLDGGETPGGAGSTVLDIVEDPPILLREGMVSRKALEACLEERIV